MTRQWAAIGWLVVLAAGSSAANAQDWPMARRDSQRVAFQPLGSDIRVPGELARLDLGGPPTGRAFWVRDADGDGEGEAYVISGGRVAAYDPDGSLRWVSEALGLSQIHGLVDVDGDGRLELVVSALRVVPVLFDALTGELVATLPFGVDQAVGDVFPIDVAGETALFVSEFGGANGGHATARVVRFPDGVGAAPTVVELNTASHGYWYGLGCVAADLDGDGQVEIVALNGDAAVAYDVLSGEPVFRTPSLGDFPSGRARLHAADVDGDGRDEVIALSNNPGNLGVTSKRLLLLELEAGMFGARWEYRVDATMGDHRFIRQDTAVLRAGEGLSIVTSALNPTTGHYETLIWPGDSATNTPAATLDQRVILALWDMDGDGVSELLTQDVSGDYVAPLGKIRALRWKPDGSFEELAQASNAAVALEPIAFFASATRPVAVDGVPLVLRDADGDRQPESIVRLGGPAFGSAAADGLLELRSERSGRVWSSRTRGEIGVLAADGTLLNDTAADGTPDLSVATRLAPALVVAHDDAGPLLATIDAGGKAVVFAAAAGGPLWTSAEPVATPHPMLTWLVTASAPELSYTAQEQDGTLSLVTRTGREGAEISRVSLGSSSALVPLNDVVPLRRADGSLVGVVVGTLDRRTGEVRYQLVDPSAGISLSLELGRNLRNGEYPVTAHDQDGDGVEDAYVVQVNRLRVASGADGSELLNIAQPRFGGMYSFVDLDADGVLDALHGGGFGRSGTQPGYGARRLTEDLVTLGWTFEQTDFHRPVGAAAGAFAGFHLGLARRTEADFSVLDSAGLRLGGGVPAGGSVYVNSMDAEAASATQGELSAMIGLAGDTAGASFLMGSTDGFLYALRASDGGLRWSLPLRARVGEPIAADAVGSGVSQVLVAAGDGAIHVIGQAMLAAPDAVFDDDGDTLAGSDAADLDELHVSDLVGADWPAAGGATGYETTLLREDGFVVVPWVDVGVMRSVRYEGLSLEAGVHYQNVVRAYDRSGAITAVSPEVSSDGFIVVDDAAPTATLTADPTLVFREAEGAPSTTLLTLTARDTVGLRSFRLRVQAPDGSEVRMLAEGPASGRERIVESIWDGRGDDGALLAVGRYEGVAEVTDANGRVAEARVPITLCGAGAPAELGCDAETDAGMADAGGTDSGAADGTLAGGGGCGCGVVGSGASQRLWLLGLPLGFMIWRRRRS